MLSTHYGLHLKMASLHMCFGASWSAFLLWLDHRALNCLLCGLENLRLMFCDVFDRSCYPLTQASRSAYISFWNAHFEAWPLTILEERIKSLCTPHGQFKVPLVKDRNWHREIINLYVIMTSWLMIISKKFCEIYVMNNWLKMNLPYIIF